MSLNIKNVVSVLLFFIQRTVRECTVVLEVTLHFLSSPGDLGSIRTDHIGTLSTPLLVASIICCVYKAGFLINRHAKLNYCLFVQSEKASRLSFLSGEFSARQSYKLKLTLSSLFLPTEMQRVVHRKVVSSKWHLTRETSVAGHPHGPSLLSNSDLQAANLSVADKPRLPKS